MSVAAPVLERDAETEEREYTREYRENYMSADERHNSLIGEKYAKLINPEYKLKDIINKEPVQYMGDTASVNAEPVREVEADSIYLVENARADADIFRADSPINRRTVERVETVASAPVSVQSEEEENEDLRPTQTTIQYKTAGVKKTVEEGKIEVNNSHAKKFSLGLTKKDKIIIAVALTVIVALFVLIIVNSAVISNLNKEVSTLQSSLAQAEMEYDEALSATQSYLDKDNFYQVVNDFVNENGMILK